VGSGALGCEILKNLAMMGLSSSDCASSDGGGGIGAGGKEGCLTITDNDMIERSTQI